MRKIFISGFIILLIYACNQNKKQINNTSDTDSLKEKSEIKFANNSEIETFPQDSFYSLLNGSYNFPDTIVKNIPLNSANYFSSIRFPYYFPKSLRLDYFCKELPFKLTDFYIFNKKNKSNACEYIALIDTNGCSKIIARQCIDMENWIILYLISKDYKIINKELLMVTGGDVDDEALSFNSKTIKYNDYIDSLKYENGVYLVSRSDIYSIKDSSDKTFSDIGFQTIKILNVKSNGEIIRSDSITIKKEYIDKYEELNNYRFK